MFKEKWKLWRSTNAANEVLVDAFLNNKIKYNTISEILDKIMKVFSYIKEVNINDLIETDKKVRELTKEYIEEYAN